jgi:PAS domain S-box-containing protein
LASSRPYLSAILDAALDAVISMDEAGRVTFWNPQAERIFGWTAEEARGRTVAELIIPAADREAHRQGLQRFRATGEGPILSRRIEVTGVRRDGQRLPVELTVTPVREGETLGFNAFLRDLTEARRATTRLAAQYTVARTLAEAASLEEAIGPVLGAVGQAIECDVGALWAVEEGGAGLRCRHVWTRPGLDASRLVTAMAAGALARGEGLPGRVWAEARPLWIPDLAEDVGFRRATAAREAGLLSCLASPIAREGEVLAVLEFFSGSAREADEGLLSMLEAIGRHVGIFIDRRRSADDLLERTRLAALGRDVGLALTRTGPLAETLRQCAEAIVARVPAQMACIYILDGSRGILEGQALARPFAREGPPPRILLSGGGPAVLARERRPHVAEDAASDPVFGGEWAVTKAVGGYPLLFGDALIGLLVFGAHARPTPAQDETLRGLASALALGIARKQGEEERAQLFALEQQARRQAETANRLKDEFLATLSHELRTPLNAIMGWAQLLRAGTLEEADALRALEAIDRNAATQNQLISDILDVSRIVAGKMRLAIRPMDPAAVAEAALETVRPAAEAKQIRIGAALDHGAPIVADPDRLQQVIWNLLANAIRFTPRGGEVTLRVLREPANLAVVVEDTGPGIREDFLPYVFDRFRQGDSTSTRAHGGLGLGLAIVRHLVELHGGTVQAGNRPRGGATLTVRIPAGSLATEEGAVAPAPGPGAWLEAAPSLRGTRVLFVDDDQDAREIVAAVLRQCGAEVRVATSAEEGIAALRQEVPDVLISDLEMPGEDGYSLLRQVRALPHDQGGQVPAAALTAYASARDHLRILEAGYQVHVPKPVQPAALAVMVATLAGRR